MTYPKTKDQTIETLRGFTIILVVAGYIIQGEVAKGGHSHFLMGLKSFYYCLKPVRMPLFTVISAYLYAHFPATPNTLFKLIKGKTKRILIPFFCVSAIQYTFFTLFHIEDGLSLTRIWMVYLYPFHQFWFLLAIFWIFIIVGYLDSIKGLDTKEKWLSWMVLSSVTHIFLNPTHMFALWGINYLLPFFLLGYGINRFSKELFNTRFITFYFVLMLVAYGLYFHFRTLEPDDHLYKAVTLLCSFSVVPVIFHFRRNIPLLSKIGYYAFGIHVFNKISSGLPQIAFEHLHITNEMLIFFTYLLCAIVISIGIQIVMERFTVTRKYILGMKEAPAK